MSRFFLYDLQCINWNIENVTDITNEYDEFSNGFIRVANKHTPSEKRNILPKQIQYMNKDLKSAIYKKRMLYNKVQKFNIQNLGSLESSEEICNQRTRYDKLLQLATYFRRN